MCAQCSMCALQPHIYRAIKNHVTCNLIYNQNRATSQFQCVHIIIVIDAKQIKMMRLDFLLAARHRMKAFDFRLDNGGKLWASAKAASSRIHSPLLNR